MLPAGYGRYVKPWRSVDRGVVVLYPNPERTWQGLSVSDQQLLEASPPICREDHAVGSTHPGGKSVYLRGGDGALSSTAVSICLGLYRWYARTGRGNSSAWI